MVTIKSAALGGGAVAIGLVILVLAGNDGALEPGVAARASLGPATALPLAAAEHQGFLYGRVTVDGGATYEGRLRFGGNEEAFWGDYFNGVKDENPWATYTSSGSGDGSRRPIEIFGFTLSLWGGKDDLGRPFMARFGDIARIEARGRDLRVALKSHTVLRLDRFAADDLADGVRVWDGRRGVVDLDEWRIHSIEFMPTARLEAASARLHGTVHTRYATFTGFIQWDRDGSVGADEFVGRTADGELRLPFETIRSIARRSHDSVRATLRDGRERVLSGTRHAGRGHRGIYVDDRRYGRVLVPWEAFERLDFSAEDSGPAYTDFPAGQPLTGRVTTHAGRQLTGRLVYDLDESETTETLDAPAHGVTYTIPFGLIAAIAPLARDEDGRARVRLHDGEELSLERAGDLGEGNAGLLIFAAGRERAEHVPWTDVVRVELDRPPAMYPPP